MLKKGTRVKCNKAGARGAMCRKACDHSKLHEVFTSHTGHKCTKWEPCGSGPEAFKARCTQQKKSKKKARRK